MNIGGLLNTNIYLLNEEEMIYVEVKLCLTRYMLVWTVNQMFTFYVKMWLVLYFCMRTLRFFSNMEVAYTCVLTFLLIVHDHTCPVIWKHNALLNRQITYKYVHPKYSSVYHTKDVIKMVPALLLSAQHNL